MNSHKTLIFVPTYNERDNAPELFRQILALGLDADLLFLDDNSPDGTGQLLDELAAAQLARPGNHARLHVIHRTGKLGIGSAHVDGINWAYDRGYTRLVTMDCDFIHAPADIPRLLACADGAAVVVGSRWLQSGSLPGWNLSRRMLTGLGHLLTRCLLRVPYDATGAFRVYDLVKIPRYFFARVASPGYAFFFESLFLLIRNGFTVKEVPVALPARTYGHSKMSFWEAGRSAGWMVKLYFTTLLDPETFCIPEPVARLNAALVDPQHWDEYWDKKKRTVSVVYDVIAATPGEVAGTPQRFASARLGEVYETRLSVRCQVENPDKSDEALVAFSRAYYPGYRAFLDGAELPVLALNGLQPAVRIPPLAKGELRLTYAPKSLM